MNIELITPHLSLEIAVKNINKAPAKTLRKIAKYKFINRRDRKNMPNMNPKHIA